MSRLIASLVVTLTTVSAWAQPDTGTEPKSGADALERVRAESMAIVRETDAAAHDTEPSVALKGYKRAVRLDPDNHAAWYRIGRLYVKQRKWLEAKDAFEQTVRLRSDEPMYRLYLGISAFHERDNKVAEGELTRAVTANPRLYRGHYYLGRVYSADGRSQDAARSFTHACTLEPAFGKPYVHLAMLYMRWDFIEEAQAVLEQAAQHVSDREQRVNIFYYSGLVHDTRRDYPAAVAAYTEAIKLDPQILDAYFQRGLCYAKMGDKKRARADLLRFMRDDNGNSNLREQANKILMELIAN